MAAVTSYCSMHGHYLGAQCPACRTSVQGQRRSASIPYSIDERQVAALENIAASLAVIALKLPAATNQHPQEDKGNG